MKHTQSSEVLNATVAQAINFAILDSMEKNPKLVTFGLGINDPKRIFGTTDSLVERFGTRRVFDFPTSENAMTGFAIGLAISGIPNITVHQRSEFFLLAMDQIVNNAAKWNYMFGSGQSVPLVVRLIVGKGWGQGPTHSQSFHAWFSHIPGLKVVVPHDSESAYRLLTEAISDPNPVIFIEHRWLHHQDGELPSKIEKPQSLRIQPSSQVEELGDATVTVVSFSYLTSRVRALYPVFTKLGIGLNHVILETLKPYDFDSIKESLKKTGKLLVLDFAPRTNSFAKEIVSEIALSEFGLLLKSPRILSLPDYIQPTSFQLTRKFEFTDVDIVMTVAELAGKSELGKDETGELIDAVLNVKEKLPHDVPDYYFKGPF